VAGAALVAALAVAVAVAALVGAALLGAALLGRAGHRQSQWALNAEPETRIDTCRGPGTPAR